MKVVYVTGPEVDKNLCFVHFEGGSVLGVRSGTGDLQRCGSVGNPGLCLPAGSVSCSFPSR